MTRTTSLVGPVGSLLVAAVPAQGFAEHPFLVTPVLRRRFVVWTRRGRLRTRRQEVRPGGCRLLSVAPTNSRL